MPLSGRVISMEQVIFEIVLAILLEKVKIERAKPTLKNQAVWREGQARRNLPNFFRRAGVRGRNPFSFKMRSQAFTVKGFPASSRVSTNGKPESVVPKETDVFLGMGFEITDGMLKDIFAT